MHVPSKINMSLRSFIEMLFPSHTGGVINVLIQDYGTFTSLTGNLCGAAMLQDEISYLL